MKNNYQIKALFLSLMISFFPCISHAEELEGCDSIFQLYSSYRGDVDVKTFDHLLGYFDRESYILAVTQHFQAKKSETFPPVQEEVSKRINSFVNASKDVYGILAYRSICREEQGELFLKAFDKQGYSLNTSYYFVQKNGKWLLTTPNLFNFSYILNKNIDFESEDFKVFSQGEVPVFNDVP